MLRVACALGVACCLVAATHSVTVSANRTARAPRVSPTLLSHFAILRRQHRHGDVPPLGNTSAIVKRAGVILSAARRARTRGRESVYLIPGPRRICVFLGLHYGSWVCGVVANAIKGVDAAGTTLNGKRIWALLLPDGTHDVVKITSNATQKLRVLRNVAVVRYDARQPAPTI